VTVAHRRDAVAFLQTKGVSEQRACRLLGLGRSSLRYRPCDGRDEALRQQLLDLARRHPRYGYRRAWAVLRRDGWTVNLKRVHRVWRELGLAVPRPRRRRRRRGGRPDPVPVRAEHPGHVWAYDFVKDHCENGQALRILTLVDEFTRECLAIEVGGSLGARRVIAVLERSFAEHGPPEWLRSDNGPEFIAEILKVWLAERGARPRYIDPGCPWQNAFGESFNGRLRDECLNLELFANRLEATVVLEAWRLDYNLQRPHSSLGYKTPREFREALKLGETPDPAKGRCRRGGQPDRAAK
jgi:putative transposase